MVQAFIGEVRAPLPVKHLTADANENTAVGTEGAQTSSLPMRKRKQEVLLNSSSMVPTVTGTVDKVAKLHPNAVINTTTPLPTPAMTVKPDGVPAYSTDILRMAKEHAASAVAAAPSVESDLKPIHRAPMPKAREIRLEQNRKAARESRRRKKIMIEELQRSVVFFSRANGTLKQQNDELQRLLIAAQSKVQAYENGALTSTTPSVVSNGSVNTSNDTIKASVPVSAPGSAPIPVAPSNPEPATVVANVNTTITTPVPAPVPVPTNTDQLKSKEHRDVQAQEAVASAQAQAQAQQQQAAHAAATQAMFQNQGFPPAAARAAAQTFVSGPPSSALAVNVAPNTVTAPSPGVTVPVAAPAPPVTSVPVPSPVAATTTADVAASVPVATAAAPVPVPLANQVQMWPILMSMGAAAAASTAAAAAAAPATNADATSTSAQAASQQVQAAAASQQAQAQQQQAAVQNAFLATMQQQFSQQMQQQGFNVNAAAANTANNLFQTAFVPQVQQQVQAPVAVPQGVQTQTQQQLPIATNASQTTDANGTLS